MKRIITVIASIVLVVSAAGIASAEMVNIGVAAIDKSIDDGIRARVAGVSAPAVADAAKPAPPVNIGIAEIDAADLAALQDYVSGRKEMIAYSGKTPVDSQSHIGVVAMSNSELQEIKNMTSWMKDKGPGQRLFEKLHARFK